MTETRPIPDESKAALHRLGLAYRAQVHQLAVLTVKAEGLSETDNWTVDFDAGVMRRDVPDTTPARSNAT